MIKTKFDGLMVTLASSEKIEERSHGVVDYADTINYRTGKPKFKWLFCEAIFWPIKNFECSCGKYKWVRYKGIVCERCGVEVESSRVRRERMGHIDLASPVVHAWYQSSVAWWVHHLLWLSWNEIQKIVSYVKYVVTTELQPEEIDIILQRLQTMYDDSMIRLDAILKEEQESIDENKKKGKSTKVLLDDLTKKYEKNKSDLDKEINRLKSIVADFQLGSTVLESDVRNVLEQFDDILKLKSWPEAIYDMLKRIDVYQAIKWKLEEFRTIKSAEQKKKAFSLIKLLINLYTSGVRPENMVLTKLPVIPPDLRPVVQLDGWRFASSDVNTFYRRVLMRNIRLKKMIQVWMPDVVKKNEIRLLQESVNNLLVWEKNTTGRAGAGNKVLKSMSDMLSGKEWVFRKNLLWKRVDYSWRSVITAWPELKLSECGLPLYIAIKMFTPFIIGKLIEKKIVYTPKQAEKLIKEWDPIALRYLEEVVKDKYVLLNRAPTLHRLSIEAFKVKLMPWKTIRIHPLVTPSFNADFDWDQMAVHLPISDEAQKEAKELIAADKNILKPSSWEPTITHSQDMILGIYYLTDDYSLDSQMIWRFAQMSDVIVAYDAWDAMIKDKVTLIIKGEPIETTVGRVIFNDILPEWVPFINKSLGKKDLKWVLSMIFDTYSMEETVRVADAIKDLGFFYATRSGISINITDVEEPKEKEEFLKHGDELANRVYKMHYHGFLSEDEKHRSIVQIRSKVKAEIEECVTVSIKPGNNFHYMITPWARWSYANTSQMWGMKWLVLNPRGRVIELPIKWNLLSGLSPIEYFISSHSSRKGKADTALRTAESGYLTRKLCDSSQEVIIREEICSTTDYIIVSRREAEHTKQDFDNIIHGRVSAQDVIDSHGTVIIKKNDLISKENLTIINDLEIDNISIRSPLTCTTVSGICQKCYGMDLATRNIVALWSAVWIIAAQSIWEPATQLTMRTFHDWGTQADKADMTQGIDRIKQLFEIRTPKNPAIVSPFDGVVKFSESWKLKYIHIISEYEQKTYLLKKGYTSTAKKGETLLKWWVYAVKGRSKLKIKEEGTILEVHKDHVILWVTHTVKKSLTGLSPLIKVENEKIFKWQVLTSWALDIREYMEIVWDLEAQKYVIREVKKIYAGQWQMINDKHIELVVKQLFSKVFIEDAGDSNFVPGTHVKFAEFVVTNKKLEDEGKKPSQWRRLALWLTAIAKQTDSRLSAASFQETIRVMVESSLKWSIDELNDLKSNVIIWRLLPLGEEFTRQKRQKKEKDEILLQS